MKQTNFEMERKFFYCKIEYENLNFFIILFIFDNNKIDNKSVLQNIQNTDKKVNFIDIKIIAQSFENLKSGKFCF